MCFVTKVKCRIARRTIAGASSSRISVKDSVFREYKSDEMPYFHLDYLDAMRLMTVGVESSRVESFRLVAEKCWENGCGESWFDLNGIH